MNYIGIDLGLYGAFWSLNNNYVGRFLDMPLIKREVDLKKAKSYFENFNPKNSICIIEKVFFSKLLKGKKGWNFGRNTMAIEALVFGMNFEIKKVTPKEWHNFFGIGTNKRESIKKAIQIYPSLKNKFYYHRGKRKVLKDGRADACLIAEYGKRMFQIKEER